MSRVVSTICFALLTAAALSAEPARIFIAPEPDRTWLVTAVPDVDGEAITRIGLWTSKDDKVRAFPVPGKPKFAVAFKERLNDRWGLCVLLDEKVRWIEDGHSHVAEAPPLSAIHDFSASETLLYVLGNGIRLVKREEKAGELTVLIFNGHLWRQWPHPLPKPAGAKRPPKLVALDDGFALLYSIKDRWIRYDCRDGAAGEGVELLSEAEPPPTSATMLAVGKQIVALHLGVNRQTQSRDLLLTRLRNGRWQKTVSIEPEGFSPRLDDPAAFGASGKTIWVMFTDTDEAGKPFYGRFDVDAEKVTLRPAAEMVKKPEPEAINTSMLLTVGVIGLLLLLIWRRGARDARWLVRSAALPVAPWGRRIIAAMIDLLPAVIISTSFFHDGWLKLQTELEATDPVLGAESWLAVGSLMGIYLLHTTIGELLTRASLGKRLMQLTVVDERGRPARRGQILIRNVFRVADLMPILLLVMLVTRYRQRLGDLMAKTVVAMKAPRNEDQPPEEPNE